MAYRSWLAAAGVALVVLAVVVGGSLMSGGPAGESAGQVADPSPGRNGASGGGVAGDPGPADPAPPGGSRRSGVPMPLPEPVPPRDQAARPDLRPASIQTYELLAADRLQLRYTSGVPECYGRLGRAAVSETPERVTVTLLLRPPGGAATRACPDIAVVDDTVVRLTEPLGHRTVVDGGTQRRVRRGHEPH